MNRTRFNFILSLQTDKDAHFKMHKLDGSSTLVEIEDLGARGSVIVLDLDGNRYRAIEKNLTLMTELWEPALGMKCDGLVIKIEEARIRRHLGLGTKSPNWAIAFKVQSMEGVTRLLDVVWQVGRTGVLTPVGLLEPINLGGAVIQRVTLNNLTWIREHGLTRGCLIRLVRSGDVIPKVLGRVSE